MLLDTNGEGQPFPYPYGVHCERVDGGWVEGSTSNGPGWSQVGPNIELGTLADWSEAPAGADRVRLTYNGEVREEPIENDWFLAAWWGVPWPDDRWPRVEAWRVGGQWVREGEQSAATPAKSASPADGPGGAPDSSSAGRRSP